MPAARTLRRLRLRAGSQAEAHGMAIRFEDALRTASFPDTGNRLIFVRRLNLGRIRSGSSSMTLSLLLADALEREHPLRVCADSQISGDAPSVWFSDALHAHTLLAQRVAAGRDCSAWFWPLAVSGFVADAPVVDSLRLIALSLAIRAEAPVALPKWVVQLVSDGHSQALIEAFDAPTILRLQPHANISVLAHKAASPEAREDIRSTSPNSREHPRIFTLDLEPTAQHAPAVGLIVAWLRAEQRTDLIPRLPRRSDSIRSTMRTLAKAEAADASLPATKISARRSRARSTPNSDNAPTRRIEQSPAALNDASASSIANSPQNEAHAIEVDRSEHRPMLLGEDTTAGGIGFLFGALARLGYPQWSDSQPQWADRAILPRLFARALSTARVSKRDPAWRLARHAPAASPPPQSFVAPSHWCPGLLRRGHDGVRHRHAHGGIVTDASECLPLAAWWGEAPERFPPTIERIQDASIQRQENAEVSRIGALALKDRDGLIVEAWYVALRRWLRRYAGVGLKELVRRPGRIALTPTHLDVWLDLSQTDLRVRRCGLDLDPGWLAWFGRVVEFHYANAMETAPWA